MRSKYFALLTREAKAGQKSIVPARLGQRVNQGWAPFICTPWVPIHFSFNSQQGPPLSSLSGFHPNKTTWERRETSNTQTFFLYQGIPRRRHFWIVYYMIYFLWCMNRDMQILLNLRTVSSQEYWKNPTSIVPFRWNLSNSSSAPS